MQVPRAVLSVAEDLYLQPPMQFIVLQPVSAPGVEGFGVAV